MFSHNEKISCQPTAFDILCGRGKTYNSHHGNLVFSATIKANVQRYIEMPRRNDRNLLVASLVEKLMVEGYRFLKKNKGTDEWSVMTTHQAHEKLGHAIRDKVKKQKDHVRSQQTRNLYDFSSAWTVLPAIVQKVTDGFPDSEDEAFDSIMNTIELGEGIEIDVGCVGSFSTIPNNSIDFTNNDVYHDDSSDDNSFVDTSTPLNGSSARAVFREHVSCSKNSSEDDEIIEADLFIEYVDTVADSYRHRQSFRACEDFDCLRNRHDLTNECMANFEF